MKSSSLICIAGCGGEERVEGGVNGCFFKPAVESFSSSASCLFSTELGDCVL